ncbi:MAG: hypothetical protein ABW185_23095 [Sedimenticola sp.]
MDQWRSRIGCFTQPRKCRTHIQTLSVDRHTLSLGIRTILFFLLVAHGVESNPGPRPGNRGSGATAATRARGAGTSRDSLDSADNESSRSRALRSSQSSQPPINAWFGRDNEAELTPDLVETDIRQLMGNIYTEVKQLNKKFDSIQTDVTDIKTQNEFLTKRVTTLEEKLNVCETQLEHIESQSRRDNLLFHGIQDENGESWELAEEKVQNYLSSELNINGDIEMERAHRLGRNVGARPIIAKFSKYKDRERVLKTYRDKQREARAAAATNPGETPQPPNIRISEDFPARVRKIRSKLIPFLREKLNDGNTAFIRYDKLIVNNVAYSYDSIGNKLTTA